MLFKLESKTKRIGKDIRNEPFNYMFAAKYFKLKLYVTTPRWDFEISGSVKSNLKQSKYDYLTN